MKKYDRFKSQAIRPNTNGELADHLDVIFGSHKGDPFMCVTPSAHYQYISKQQAMDFFGLVDPAEVEHIEALPLQGSEVPWWNVLYLENTDQLVVLHTEVQGNDLREAIAAAREYLGDARRFVSITLCQPELEHE